MSFVQPLLTQPDAETDAVPGGCSPTPPSLSLFKQPILGFRYDELIVDIRKAHAEAFTAEHRPGMASIILLAHHLKLISKTDIDSAVSEGTPAFYALYRQSIAVVGTFLDKTAQAWAGERTVDWEFTPLSLDVTSGNGRSYLRIESGLHFSQFNLSNIEADIASLVYGCLVFITRDIGFGLLPSDLDGLSPMLEEELEAFRECLGNREHLSLPEWAESILEHEVYPFSEYYSDAESLAERLEFLHRIIDHPLESIIGSSLAMPDIAQAVDTIKRTERHRLINPWLRFIRKAVVIWRKRQRRPSLELSIEAVDEGYEDVPLDYGHAIGAGLPWEEIVVDELYQGMYEAGEAAATVFLLTSDTVPALADKLTALAQARGLLRCAEFADSFFEKPHET